MNSAATALRPLAGSTQALEIAGRIREAAARRSGLRICGAGTWMDGGRPVAGSVTLQVPPADAPTEHVPGDLTITAPAGMSLGALATTLRGHGQFLALDPFGGDRGTIGATVATASAGPLAHAFGSPRDHVLGVEFVTGRGDIVRGGGRVVKNVAGFDLARLVTGAWGTLGVITEVTLRLRALPEADRTIALATPSDAAGLAHLLERLRAAPLAPWALEVIDPAMARFLSLPGEPQMLARIAGSAASVEAQRRAAAAIADVDDVADPAIWSRLRGADDGASAVVRWSDWPASLAKHFVAARRLAEPHDGLVHATVGRGSVRAILRAGDDGALGATIRGHAAPRRIVERAPAIVWESVPPAAGDSLSQRARDAFDPQRVLNPGILGAESA